MDTAKIYKNCRNKLFHNRKNKENMGKIITFLNKRREWNITGGNISKYV